MAAETIALIGVAVLVLLMVLRVPVAYALGAVGLVGLWLVVGPTTTLGVAGKLPFTKVASYSLAVVPLFILTGYFTFHAGFATQIFNTATAWLGPYRGGLPIATVFGAAAFGAASGSGLASTATLARVAIPEMIRSGVAPRLAYGVVGAAGPLAQMIPPSVLLLVYAIIAEQSVGKLLMAGVIPGLIIASSYIAVIYVRVRLDPSMAPPTPAVPMRVRLNSLRGIWGIGVLAIVIMGGIYTGYFTPTEAGGVGAFWAFFLAVALRRLSWRHLSDSLWETVKTTAMLFMIIVGAFIFSQFLGLTRLPVLMSEWITSLPVAPTVIIIGIILFYLVLGLFIDMIAAMFLTLPIILPPVLALGFDPIWFGVVMVCLAEVALVTPPFGLGLFIIKGAVKESDMKEIIAGVAPFIIGDMVTLALLVAFPQIVLWLPNMM